MFRSLVYQASLIRDLPENPLNENSCLLNHTTTDTPARFRSSTESNFALQLPVIDYLGRSSIESDSFSRFDIRIHRALLILLSKSHISGEKS